MFLASAICRYAFPRLCACLVLAVLASSVNATDIAYRKGAPYAGSPVDETILIRGEIVPGDCQKFIEFIRKDPARFERQTHITVASLGGDIVEALCIADVIRYTYLSLRVREDAGPCVSACFFLWVSAVDRFGPPARVGIHRPYIDPEHVRRLGPSESQELQDSVLRDVRQFLVDSVVPSPLIDTLFQRASTEVYWLTTDDVLSIGLQAPWYEEYLIANCGYKKGVAAGLLRSNSGSPEQKAVVEYMRQVLACGRSKAESERREFIGQIVIQSDDSATPEDHDPSYVRKVLGVRELIRDKQIRTEGVATVVLNGREFNDEGWSFPASAVERLEASQTWWMNLDEDTDWAHFTVYVRNTTEKALSALVFQLSDAECKTGRGRGPLFALQLVEPMRPLEDRAIRFSAELPDGHPLLHGDGPVCGMIVGAK
jgi:hypothetical protein